MTERLQNARRKYRQLILSGWGSSLQPPNANDNNAKEQSKPAKEEKFDWQSGKYLVNIPFIVEKIALLNGQYEVHISIPLNADIPLSPINKRGKVKAEQVFYLPAETSKDGAKIHLVYGISEQGCGSLSHSSERKMVEDIAYLYSRLLGIAGRTVELLVHVSNREAEGATITGFGKVTTPEAGNVGEPKKAQGGPKVRGKIRAQKAAKEPTGLAGNDGQVLGE